MNYFLFAVSTKTPSNILKDEDRLKLLGEITTTLKTSLARKETKELGEMVWLIPVENGLPYLGECIRIPTRYKCSYAVHLIEYLAEISAKKLGKAGY